MKTLTVTQTPLAGATSLPFRGIREFGKRQRRRQKTKSLIRIVYKPTHTLLGFNRLVKYQSSI